MAKETKTPFNIDITQSVDPRIADPQLLAQSGAYRGEAAKAKGAKTAATVKFLGDVGKDIYESYQYSEAASEAKNIMGSVVSPEFIGENAYKLKHLERRQEEIVSAGDTPSAEFETEIKRANAAVSSGVLSATHARAMLSAKLRERIAANPGAAPWIRKAYEEYSGSGQWDIQELLGAFKKPEADKQQEAIQKAALEADKALANDPEVQVLFGKNLGLYGGDVLKSFFGPNGNQNKRLANDIRAASVAEIQAKRVREMRNLSNEDKADATGIAAIARSRVASNDVYMGALSLANAAGKNMDVLMNSPEVFAEYFTKNKAALNGLITQAMENISREISTLTMVPSRSPVHLEELKRQYSILDSARKDEHGTMLGTLMRTWMTTSTFAGQQANLASDTILKVIQATGTTKEVWGDFQNMHAMAESSDPTTKARGQARLAEFKRDRPNDYRVMTELLSKYTVDPTGKTTRTWMQVREDIEQGNGPDNVDPNNLGTIGAIRTSKLAAFNFLNNTLANTNTVQKIEPEMNNVISYSLSKINIFNISDVKDVTTAVSGKNAPLDKWLNTLSDSEKSEYLTRILENHNSRYMSPDSTISNKIKNSINNINESSPNKIGVYLNTNGKFAIGVKTDSGAFVDYRRFEFGMNVTTNLVDLQKDIDGMNNGTSIYAAIASRIENVTTADVRNSWLSNFNAVPVQVRSDKPVGTMAVPPSNTGDGYGHSNRGLIDSLRAMVRPGSFDMRTGSGERRRGPNAPYQLPTTHDGFPARQNTDGTYSTEVSITVTDERINGGKPTNIPSLWEGKEVSEDTAIKKALESKKSYQSFDSVEEAVTAAKARSKAGGANAKPVTTAPTAAPTTVAATTRKSGNEILQALLPVTEEKHHAKPN